MSENKQSFTKYRHSRRNDDHPCVKLYKRTQFSREKMFDYLRMNKARFGRNMQISTSNEYNKLEELAERTSTSRANLKSEYGRVKL